MNQQELDLAHKKAAIEAKLHETGERDRLKEFVRRRLREEGWKNQMEMHCMSKLYIELMSERTLDQVSVASIVKEVTPHARFTMPSIIKDELLQKLKNFIKENPDSVVD